MNDICLHCPYKDARIGQPCFKLIADFESTRHCHCQIDTMYFLGNSIKRERHGTGKVLIEERIFRRTDISKVNKLVFFSKEDAERKLEEYRNDIR